MEPYIVMLAVEVMLVLLSIITGCCRFSIYHSCCTTHAISKIFDDWIDRGILDFMWYQAQQPNGKRRGGGRRGGAAGREARKSKLVFILNSATLTQLSPLSVLNHPQNDYSTDSSSSFSDDETLDETAVRVVPMQQL